MTDVEIVALLDAAVCASDAEAIHAIRSALARAHAEGLEAAARVCDMVAHEVGAPTHASAAMAAARIRSLIPAAPEVKDG